MSRQEIYVSLSRTTTPENVKFRNIDLNVFRAVGPCDAMQRVRSLIESREVEKIKVVENRIVIYDSRLTWPSIPKTVMNGYDYYVTEKLKALNSSILIVIYPHNVAFVQSLESDFLTKKLHLGGQVVVFGSTNSTLNKKSRFANQLNQPRLKIKLNEKIIYLCFDGQKPGSDSMIHLMSETTITYKVNIRSRNIKPWIAGGVDILQYSAYHEEATGFGYFICFFS